MGAIWSIIKDSAEFRGSNIFKVAVKLAHLSLSGLSREYPDRRAEGVEGGLVGNGLAREQSLRIIRNIIRYI